MLGFEIWYSYSADEKHVTVEEICGFSHCNPTGHNGLGMAGNTEEIL